MNRVNSCKFEYFLNLKYEFNTKSIGWSHDTLYAPEPITEVSFNVTEKMSYAQGRQLEKWHFHAFSTLDHRI